CPLSAKSGHSPRALPKSLSVPRLRVAQAFASRAGVHRGLEPSDSRVRPEADGAPVQLVAQHAAQGSPATADPFARAARAGARDAVVPVERGALARVVALRAARRSPATAGSFARAARTEALDAMAQVERRALARAETQHAARGSPATAGPLARAAR